MGRTCSCEKRKIIMDTKSYVFWFGAFKMISSEMIISSEPIQQSTFIEQETELIRCKFHFTMTVGVIYYTGDIYMSWRRDSCEVVLSPFNCRHLRNWEPLHPHFVQGMWIPQMPEVAASLSPFPCRSQSCGCSGHSNTCPPTWLFQLYVDTQREEEGSRLTLCFWTQGLQGRHGLRAGGSGRGGERKQLSSHTGRSYIPSQPLQSPMSSLLAVCVSPFSYPSHGKLGRIHDTHLIRTPYVKQGR